MIHGSMKMLLFFADRQQRRFKKKHLAHRQKYVMLMQKVRSLYSSTAQMYKC